MSIVPFRPYRIANKLAGLALQVPSSDDQPFIEGQWVEPIDAQAWFVEPFEGGLLIRSKENGKYFGVELTPLEGVPLIAVDREFAKVWEFEKRGPLNYRIRLRGTPLVIEFSKDNLQPGTQAKLAFEYPEETNKVWVINEGES
ncbi:hypothetical protein EI94DRAFT_1810451 [Lactarius quietus]|nr:hypothetical protein EI94DRAFT_1810451 [Lactarius quietus]